MAVKYRDGKRWRDGLGEYTRAPRPGEYYQDRGKNWRQGGVAGWVSRPDDNDRAQLLESTADRVGGEWFFERGQHSHGLGREAETLTITDRSGDGVSATDLQGLMRDIRDQYEHDFKGEKVLVSVLIEVDGELQWRNISSADDWDIAWESAIDVAGDEESGYGGDAALAGISVTVV